MEGIRTRIIRTQADVRVADAEARTEDAKIAMYQAKGEAATEAEARKRAEKGEAKARRNAQQWHCKAMALRALADELNRSLAELKEEKNGLLNEILATTIAAGTAARKAELAAKGRQVERVSYAGLVEVFKLMEKKMKEMDGDEETAIEEAMAVGKSNRLLANNMQTKKFKEMMGKWRSWRRPNAGGFEKRWKEMKRAEKKKTPGNR